MMSVVVVLQYHRCFMQFMLLLLSSLKQSHHAAIAATVCSKAAHSTCFVVMHAAPQCTAIAPLQSTTETYNVL